MGDDAATMVRPSERRHRGGRRRGRFEETLGERGWKVGYVADGKGEILRALNAWFLPRAYGFNPKGELVWRQESPEGSDLEAIRAVVEAVKEKEYARKVFDRSPAWKEALKGEKAGDSR
jgi:hypothetical protein